MSRYVISLGGNALGKDAQEQQKLVKKAAEPIVKLIEDGHEVVIVHGNGPQVGMINLAFTESSSTPDMPFPECGAMSQGYIGYHLQNAIQNEMNKKRIKKTIGSLITQVIVDEHDPLFQTPSKPVGAFYTKEEAKVLEQEKHYTMKEDSGRGYRRVVASPIPVDVMEKDMIRTLLHEGHIVVCAGGGGVPVIKKGDSVEGVAAVIDKDYASAKIAEIIDADFLVILTAVEYVYINFDKPNQKALKQITVDELQPYLQSDEFAQGSMYPKVQACLKFLKTTDKKAIISSLDKAVDAFQLKTGTIISN